MDVIPIPAPRPAGMLQVVAFVGAILFLTCGGLDAAATSKARSWFRWTPVVLGPAPMRGRSPRRRRGPQHHLSLSSPGLVRRRGPPRPAPA